LKTLCRTRILQVIIGLLCITHDLSAQNDFYLPTRPSQEKSQKSVLSADKQVHYRIGIRPAFISTKYNSSARIDSVSTPRTATPGGYITLQADFKNSVNMFVELGLIKKVATLEAPYGRDTSVRFQFRQTYFSIPIGIRYDWRAAPQQKIHFYGLLGVQLNVLLDGALWINFPQQDAFDNFVFNNPAEFSATEINGFGGIGFDVNVTERWNFGVDGRLNFLTTTFDNGISRRVFTNGLRSYNNTFSIGVNVRYQLQ
jgi:hypothetical protein